MFEILITSSVLILIVTALRFAFGSRISRRLRYAMWGIVLLRLLIPVQFFQSPVSVLNIVPYEPPVLVKYIPYEGALTIGGYEIDGGDLNEIIDAYQSGVDAPIDLYAPPVNLFAELNPLFMIWLVGIALSALWYVIINLLFYRKLCRSRRLITAEACRLPVYVVDGLRSPCLFGVYRPAIYLTPKALKSEQTTAHVLAHELIHYERLDHLWALLRNACIAAYWFNPFVWLAAILSRIDCELACDEAAVMRIGEGNRVAYGRTLVDMIARKNAPETFFYAATTMASGAQGIKKRLTMIVQNKKTVFPALIIIIIIIVIATGVTFTGALTPDIDPVKNEPLSDRAGVQTPDAVPLPGYPVNESGQTYGSAWDAMSIEELPELLHAGSYVDEDQSEVYVYTKELLDAMPKTTEEAKAMNPATGENWPAPIPLYCADGKTVVENTSCGFAPELLPERIRDLYPTPTYPVNEIGLTYGSLTHAKYIGYEPDLITCESSDGVIGYCYKTDVDRASLNGEDRPQTREDAMEYMERLEERYEEIRRTGEKHAYTIPLYAADGVTVIGEFAVGGLPIDVSVTS